MTTSNFETLYILKWWPILFLTNQHYYVYSQNTIISFGYVYFWPKNYLSHPWKLDKPYCHIREALDNNSNERQSFDDEKIQLENECSELKEKLDHLISEFSQVNEKSKQQDVELMQTNEELCKTKEKAEQNKEELLVNNENS